MGFLSAMHRQSAKVWIVPRRRVGYNRAMDTIKYVPLFSGSSGNAALIKAGGVTLLIDAGMPARSIEAALCQAGETAAGVNALLITHEHTDHIRGVGALCRRYGFPVYANAATWQAMEDKLGQIPPRSIRVFETGRDFYMKNLNVYPFPVPHDAAEAVGFRFDCRGRCLAQATDVGHADARLMDVLSGCELVLLESNHDVDMLKAGPYPYALKRRILSDRGHLSNDAAAQVLTRLCGKGLKQAILGHLSGENNYEPLALQTVLGALAKEGIASLPVSVAHRNRPTGIFELR